MELFESVEEDVPGDVVVSSFVEEVLPAVVLLLLSLPGSLLLEELGDVEALVLVLSDEVVLSDVTPTWVVPPLVPASTTVDPVLISVAAMSLPAHHANG